MSASIGGEKKKKKKKKKKKTIPTHNQNSIKSCTNIYKTNAYMT